jgi:hypothetical protein
LPGYIDALQSVKEEISGILLYGIARQSQQDIKGCLQTTPAEVLEEYAERLRTVGVCVRVFQ